MAPLKIRFASILIAASLALLSAAAFSSLLWTQFKPVIHKDLINKYAAIYKFDPLFIMALVKVESHFQKDATSHKGAVGLMQLMPETASDMARKIPGRETIAPKDLAEPDVNLNLGVHYLSLLREEFGRDDAAILAAYNAGPANARAWRGSAPLNVESIPYGETRQFVKKVLNTYGWLKRFQKIKNAC